MLVRMAHTGQVIDMIPAAAFPKIAAGLAVPLTEDPQVETFGERSIATVEVAAKFIKKTALRILPNGFGRA